MTYASGRQCCDADSHTMETEDWLSRFADANIVDRLPRISLSKSGVKSFDFIAEAVDKQIERAKQGARASDVVKGVKGWDAPGALTPTLSRNREREQAIPLPQPGEVARSTGEGRS